MDKYDGKIGSAYGGSGKTDYSNWYRAIANELATANSLKKSEIMLLAFKTGLSKKDRKEFMKELEDI